MNKNNDLHQYSIMKILAIWGAAVFPMAILAWIITPLLANDPSNPGFVRVGMITIGLIWQCILVFILIYHEAGDLKWTIDVGK